MPPQLISFGIFILQQLITHEPDIAAYCSRTVSFMDGEIVTDHYNRQITVAADVLASALTPSAEESA